jgi:uncharacterized transporter YbjL
MVVASKKTITMCNRIVRKKAKRTAQEDTIIKAQSLGIVGKHAGSHPLRTLMAGIQRYDNDCKLLSSSKI